jgi:hypothetical protein
MFQDCFATFSLASHRQGEPLGWCVQRHTVIFAMRGLNDLQFMACKAVV